MVLKLTGGRTIRADREMTWAALHNPDILRSCVPGCLALDRVTAHRFDLSVLVPFGPVSVAFAGMVETFDCDPSHRMMLRGTGNGGLAGLASGTARISLSDAPGGCHLAYIVDVEPNGPFAVMGTLLLGGLARSLVEHFSASFAAILGQPAALRPLSDLRPAAGQTS